jgi:hypothetical protein
MVLRDFLREEANESFQFVFVDFCCMPQGDRSDTEDVEFGLMLPNVT